MCKRAAQSRDEDRGKETFLRDSALISLLEVYLGSYYHSFKTVFLP